MNKTIKPVRYIGLFVGIALIFSSFLFFGRKQEVYSTLLLGGILISIVTFLWVLIVAKNWPVRLKWTAIVVLLAILENSVEPNLIDSSYRIFITQHEQTLSELNSILRKVDKDVFVGSDGLGNDASLFSKDEQQIIVDGRLKLGIPWIYRSPHAVCFVLFGRVDVHNGIKYPTDSLYPISESRHVTGNWYR